MKLAANESPRRSVIRTLFAAVATAGASFLGVAQAQSGSTPRIATGAAGVPDRQAGPKTSGKQRVGGVIRAGNLVFVGGIGGFRRP
jgi:hypothetical protein